MTEPKEYVLNIKADKMSLLKAGFIRRDFSYVLKKPLYFYDDTKNPAIYLIVAISLESVPPMMVYSITYDDGCAYPPFYNYSQRANNLVYEKVVASYNNVMDNMVKRKILKHKKEDN